MSDKKGGYPGGRPAASVPPPPRLSSATIRPPTVIHIAPGYAPDGMSPDEFREWLNSEEPDDAPPGLLAMIAKARQRPLPKETP